MLVVGGRWLVVGGWWLGNPQIFIDLEVLWATKLGGLWRPVPDYTGVCPPIEELLNRAGGLQISMT